MGNRIQARCAVLLVIATLTLPAMNTQAAEVEPPRLLDVTFLVDFVIETIDAIRAAGSPGEAAADTPAVSGGMGPVGNESASPEDGLPEFGGQIEPVG